jgi:hypothetical protein
LPYSYLLGTLLTLLLGNLCPTAFGGVEIDFETYALYLRFGNILTLCLGNFCLGNFFGPFIQPWVGLAFGTCAFGTCASDLLLGNFTYALGIA